MRFIAGLVMLMIGRGCDRGHDGFGGLVDNGGSSIPPRCP